VNRYKISFEGIQPNTQEVGAATVVRNGDAWYFYPSAEPLPGGLNRGTGEPVLILRADFVLKIERLLSS
jgi:hypothetical protein